ncbi:nucleotide sugar dehydrogenase [Halobacterium yunchengense]|uniref:nucleotide sugar dehydrogenase n=1 Tax=Halobacterium yunchengense TaxID=3108497 RepID=UPI003009B09C
MTGTLDERVQLYGSELATDRQRSAFVSGEVPVAVYGLGKMGLPLAAVYAETTGNVAGVDVDESVVRAVNRGESPIDGEPGLDDLVREAVVEGSLEAFTDGAAVAEDASLHVVIVPTLVDDDDEPDLSVVKDVARDIAAGLDAGDTVVFESTLPPRSCRDELLPLLESESGLDRSEFGLAFCPERTSSGRALRDVRGAHPKVVGGVDDESTRVAEVVYGELTSNDVIPVANATTAEAVKVFEGVYRDVNIALANELGRHADELGIDVVDAIDAANTQPFCDIHTPGAGVGGHCIPYYPHFLIQRFESSSQLMETAREINEMMPLYTTELTLNGLREAGTPPSEADVAVLGLTYRPGVAEIRSTPALPIVEHLSDVGADVTVVDPVLDDYEAFEDVGGTPESVSRLQEQSFDAVVLVTPQDAFARLDVRSLRPHGERLLVVDGRQEFTHLRDAVEVDYRGVGLHD